MKRLWLKLLRWLAADLIAEARLRGCAEATAKIEARARYEDTLAYAHGEQAGRISMIEAMDKVVADRMGRGDDNVQAEDMDRVRKGMLH